MNIVLKTEKRVLVSMSSEEILGIANAVNEICNGVHTAESEFETRLGDSREFLNGVLATLHAAPHPALRTTERADAWADGSSIQVICISDSGDPVDMGSDEAHAFGQRLQQAIKDAE